MDLEQIKNIKLVKKIIKWSQKVHIPWTKGLNLYDFFTFYIHGLSQSTLSHRAGAIAYSFFMAIFPFLLFVLNLLPYISIEGFQVKFIGLIESLMPPQTNDFFMPIITDILDNRRSGLLSFSFILSGFLASNGVNAIFKGFEDSLYVKSDRNIWQKYFIAFSVSTLLTVLLLIAVGSIIVGEFFIHKLQQDDYLSQDIFWINLLQISVFILMIYIMISILYYYGTSKNDRAKFFSFGSAITTVLFLITTYLFSIYILKISNYNELYGSIGALLIMMLYIWINANLLLIGFEVNASLVALSKDKKTKILKT